MSDEERKRFDATEIVLGEMLPCELGSIDITSTFVTIKGNIAELISNNKLLKYADKGQTAAEGEYDDFLMTHAGPYKEVMRDVLVEYQDFMQSCIAYPDTMRLIYPALELCNDLYDSKGKKIGYVKSIFYPA